MQVNALRKHMSKVTRCLHPYRVVGMPSAEVQVSYCIRQSVLLLSAIQSQLSWQQQEHNTRHACSVEPAW